MSKIKCNKDIQVRTFLNKIAKGNQHVDYHVTDEEAAFRYRDEDEHFCFFLSLERDYPYGEDQLEVAEKLLHALDAWLAEAIDRKEQLKTQATNARNANVKATAKKMSPKKGQSAKEF